MLHRLPLTLEPQKRETLPSFFSRMAALNGTDATGFAWDIGIGFKNILSQDPSAVSTFARKAGLSQDQVTSLLSWTGERIGDVRMRYRGEIFVSRALRNPIIRGCPVCLREAAEDRPSPIRHMAMAGDWLCRGVDICLKHRHPLVQLWSKSTPLRRDLIGSRMAEILPALLNGQFDRDLVTPSAYDFWIDRRLDREADETWLAGQTLFAAMTFCDLLGAEINRDGGAVLGDRADKAIGFDVARHGPNAISDALSDLTKESDGGYSTATGALGKLYKALASDYRDHEDFDGFRQIVRDYLLTIWPVGKGDGLLGQEVPERRLHSLLTASKQTGIGLTVLDDLLTEAGAFVENDRRPASRKTFDARTYAPLLDDIPRRVGRLTMCRTMGATKAEFRSLEKEGILTAATAIRPPSNRGGRNNVLRARLLQQPVRSTNRSMDRRR